MSEYVDNHPLARDLPEYREDVRELKTGDRHFARLMGEYETLGKDIVRAEQGVEHRPDLELDAMKMQRVRLKDELVALLKAHRAERAET